MQCFIATLTSAKAGSIIAIPLGRHVMWSIFTVFCINAASWWTNTFAHPCSYQWHPSTSLPTTVTVQCKGNSLVCSPECAADALQYPLQQPSSPSTPTQYKELRALALNLFLFWKNSIGSLVSLRKFYALPADSISGCLLTHWVVVPRQGHHHWDATAKAQAWTPLLSVSYSCHKPHQAAHSCRA